MNYANTKILLQYSGGKDSTACLIKLADEKAYVEAIHFTHKYSYTLPTEEAERLCRKFQIKLHIIDISEQLEKLFSNNFTERPCRFCKGIMDRLTVEWACSNNFDYICVGDTASDRTLIERIKENGDTDIHISKYFNKNVVLPDNIMILRPFIEYDNEAVFRFLEKHAISVRRNNDTGDKYFEYSREGCPLQFKDYGVCYTDTLMKILLQANTFCSEFATILGIKASIHFPSETIVTIPKGYEKQCREYLISKGLDLKKQYLIKNVSNIFGFSITIYDEICNPGKVKELFIRFFERLSESVKESISTGYSVKLNSFFSEINVMLIKAENRLMGTIKSLIELNEDLLKSLFVELFHTYDFAIVRLDHVRHIKIKTIWPEIRNSRYLACEKFGNRVIRSNLIDGLNFQQIFELKQRGISDVFDLRTKKQCRDSFIYELKAMGINYHKTPFSAPNPPLDNKTYQVEDVVDSYLVLTEQFEVCKKIFSAIATAEHGILIFCNYGRDRTGIIAMILELLCNVPIETIVNDYLLSDLYLNAEKYEDLVYERSNEIPVRFLRAFMEKYNNAYEYLKLTGLSEDSIYKLKGLLNDERTHYS